MSKDTVIRKMNERGWIYDFIESAKGSLRFFPQDISSAFPLQFKTWKEAAQWIANV